MYAVAIEYYGKYGAIVPSGNNGMQKLRNKTRRGWLSETEAMRRNTTGRVYVISEFTQEMYEMSPRKLADYIQKQAHHSFMKRVKALFRFKI